MAAASSPAALSSGSGQLSAAMRSRRKSPAVVPSWGAPAAHRHWRWAGPPLDERPPTAGPGWPPAAPWPGAPQRRCPAAGPWPPAPRRRAGRPSLAAGCQQCLVAGPWTAGRSRRRRRQTAPSGPAQVALAMAATKVAPLTVTLESDRPPATGPPCRAAVTPARAALSLAPVPPALAWTPWPPPRRCPARACSVAGPPCNPEAEPSP
mmetsp:Transcript_60710/g.172573  ORF Transcript_60710/g.172573 Transcript_60710/m.172573 type:complete len:207 (+) Transcript_60710:472-1092(+)